MKYLFLLLSGAADEALEELDGRTPLEAAHTPAADALAEHGKLGAVTTLPDDLPAAEEVAILSILGYDPHRYFTGEAGLAAAAYGLSVGPDRIAMRHNLVTEADGLLADHAAGQIAVQEAESLLASLQGALDRADVDFRVGRGFCGISVFPAVSGSIPECCPVSEAIGRPIDECLPSAEGAEVLRRTISTSREVFAEHDINRVRADLDENPANLYWPWGPGRPPVLPPFDSICPGRTAMVAAAESAVGLGRLSAMDVSIPPEATGSYRSNFAVKADAARALVESCDAVIVHLAAPLDAALEGNEAQKVRLLGDIDALVTAPLYGLARERGDVRILLAATHVVSTAARRQLRTASPVALYGPGLEPVRTSGFSETAALEGELSVPHGHELIEYFLRP